MLREATQGNARQRPDRRTFGPLGRRVALGYAATAALLVVVLSSHGLAAATVPASLALTGWLVFSALALFVVIDRFERNALANALPFVDVEACLDIVMGVLPDGLVVLDEAGTVHTMNPSAIALFGRGPAGARIDDLLVGSHAARVRADLAGDGRSARSEAVARRGDGTSFPVEMWLAPLDRGGERRFFLVLHDITSRKKALARLDVAEKVLESTMEGVMVTDRRGAILWVNQGFCRISGYDRAEVLGKPASILRSGLQGPDFYTQMWASIRETGAWAGEIWNRRKDGEAYPEWLTIRALPDASGEIGRYVGVFSDISKHKRAEETIRTLTYYDAVTRLPNRYLFMDRLHQALERAQRTERKVALVILGLDRFKQINESLGHQTGDKLLRDVAERLAGSLRGHDTVARLRGDTFCCLLTELTQGHETHSVIARLLDAFASSFELGGHEVFVTAAVGVSVYPVDGSDPDDLLQKAETAMNRSKEQADNVTQFYTPEMHAHSIERLSLETSLRKAIARNELTVHFQPKIDTASGRLVGAEALIRWQHPELGMVSPVDFIPIAEATGLIIPIGNWVLDHVCRRIREWQQTGTPVVPIAVNISAHQFRQPDLVDRVVEALTEHEVDPALIELELTESAVMHNAEVAIRTLMELHDQGIRLSVDDFGTGYSSLSYLKKFPLHKLKIDRSFVLDLDTNPGSVEIVGAIIAMAHSLNLAVVAEGVEREAQLDILKGLKADEIQGFYYSRPIPAETFAQILCIGKLAGKAA